MLLRRVDKKFRLILQINRISAAKRPQGLAGPVYFVYTYC